MLRADVVEAIRKGTFAVYPIKSIDQGIELLTGVPAGRARKNGSYDAATVNGKVTAQLSAFVEAAKALSVSPNDRSGT